MKKIGYLVIMLVIALAGCTERQNPLLKQAKDLIDVRPDSAMTILTQVNLRSLSESQKAENHGVSPDHFQESDISMLYYLSHSHFT